MTLECFFFVAIMCSVLGVIIVCSHMLAQAPWGVFFSVYLLPPATLE